MLPASGMLESSFARSPAVALLVSVVAFGCSSADPADPSSDTEAAMRSEVWNPLPRHFPTNERFVKELASAGGGGNLINHGGATLANARVVAIFWGPSWSSTDPISRSITSYLASFGTSGEYNVITQYSSIQKTNLSGDSPAVWYDSSTPPTNVTDSAVRTEVSKFISGHGFDPNAIYEVFLPNGVYSSFGSSTSCGGPNLRYCAYHDNFLSSIGDVKYAAMPYPSCGGCQTAGFTAAQNLEHFTAHETREAVTDADGTAWYDRRGYEADDKCAWSPTPFVDSTNGTNADGSGFAYQYEWSNATSSCVKTR
jgi:hypothetical protein